AQLKKGRSYNLPFSVFYFCTTVLPQRLPLLPVPFFSASLRYPLLKLWSTTDSHYMIRVFLPLPHRPQMSGMRWRRHPAPPLGEHNRAALVGFLFLLPFLRSRHPRCAQSVLLPIQTPQLL